MTHGLGVLMDKFLRRAFWWTLILWLAGTVGTIAAMSYGRPSVELMNAYSVFALIGIAALVFGIVRLIRLATRR